MKRKVSSDMASNIKRLRSVFETATFPEVPENDAWFGSWDKVNLLPYARTHEPDVLVSNGHVEFQAHKRVLKAISTVFSDLILGDSQIDVLTLQVNDFALEQLQKIIYDFDPNVCWTSLKAQIRKSPEDTMHNMCLLMLKYDVKRLYAWFQHWVMTYDGPIGQNMDMEIWCILKGQCHKLSQLGMPLSIFENLLDMGIVVGEKSEDAFMNISAELALDLMIHCEHNLYPSMDKDVEEDYRKVFAIFEKYEKEKISDKLLINQSAIERSFSTVLILSQKFFRIR